jgi:hypothetical protein
MTSLSESDARELVALEAAVFLRGSWQVAALAPTRASWRPWQATLTSTDADLAGYVVVADVDMNGAVSLSDAHRPRTGREQLQVGARLVVAMLALLAGFGWAITALPLLIGTLAGWGLGGTWPMTELCAAVSPVGLAALLWSRSDHFDVWTFSDPAARRVTS